VAPECHEQAGAQHIDPRISKTSALGMVVIVLVDSRVPMLGGFVGAIVRGRGARRTVGIQQWP